MILTVKEKKPIKCNIEAQKARVLHYNTLSQCYGKCSNVKQSAYYDCIQTLESLDELNDYSTRFYGISSYNCFVFTFTGLFQKVNKETGEIETYMYYSTKTKDEIYKLIDQ